MPPLRTLLVLVLAASCGDDGAAPPDGGRDAGPLDAGRDAAADAGVDAAPGDAAADASLDAPVAPDGGSSCPRLPGPADGPRRVVISHPFDAAGMQSDDYRLLQLTAEGEVVPMDTRFRMGRAAGGEIVFTPDGEIGVVAQDDGSLGVFRLTGSGVEVVHDHYTGAFYAASVVMSEDGASLWVLDSEFRDIGGGLYRLDIGCDGTLSGERLVVPAQLPYALVLRGDGTALLAARDVLGSTPGHDLFILSLSEVPVLLAGVDAFGDDEAIVSSLALSEDGSRALVGDNCGFCSGANRVATADVADASLSARTVMHDLEDPVDIEASPFDDSAIVVSGFGDAIFVVARAGATDRVVGELSYAGARPQLPGRAVQVRQGTLRGLTLVAENLAVRRVRFEASGGVTDLGPTPVAGSGTENIVGAIGVTP